MNQRAIVAGWDDGEDRPKGVASAADVRASLAMIAAGEGIMQEPGAAVVSLSATSMRITWTPFTAVIKSSLGGWYTPRIAAGGVDLAVGDATYPRIDVVWVKQHDYQTDASQTDSPVEVGVVRGVPSASPPTPGVPSGAIPVFMVRVPSGARVGTTIGISNITRASWVAPAGGVVQAASEAEAAASAKAAAASPVSPLLVYRTDLQSLRVYTTQAGAGQVISSAVERQIIDIARSDNLPAQPGFDYNLWDQSFTVSAPCDIEVHGNVQIMAANNAAGFGRIYIDEVNRGTVWRFHSHGSKDAALAGFTRRLKIDTPGTHTLHLRVSADSGGVVVNYQEAHGQLVVNP